MVFLASNSHRDIMKLLNEILSLNEIKENELKILYLSFEILTNFGKVTTKGTARILGEEVEIGEEKKFKFVNLVIKGFSLKDQGKL